MFNINIMSNIGNSLSISSVIPETWQMLAIFISFIVATFFFSTLKKIIYRIRFRKRYYIFPRIGVKGITNIAMVISIAVAAIILLTVVSAGFMGVLFRAYPGWRVTIEGILIKIGGLLFGPIIGLFIGATTDILSVALTAGMFHYGYFFGAMAYGFFAGLVRTVINLTKNRQVPMTVILVLVCGIVMAAVLAFISTLQFANGAEYLDITILGASFPIYKWMLYAFVSVAFVFGMGTIIICLIIYDRALIEKSFLEMWYFFKYKMPVHTMRNKLLYSKDKELVAKEHMIWTVKNNDRRQKTLQKISNKKFEMKTTSETNWFSYFAPVAATVLIGEAIIEILMLPFFDQEFSSFPYDHWFVLRTIMFMVMSFMNTLVIYPVYRIVCPTMKYNYTSDIVESVSTPLMNE